MLIAGQGVAGAEPGQPGLAVPGEGQPGLSTTPEPPVVAPAPSPADYIPDPPVAPPNRPRPQQQTQPNIDTLVTPQTPDSDEPEAVEPQVPEPNAPAVMPADPHQLRVGTSTVQLPDFIDVRTRNKAQAYLDMAEWQIAAMYDGMGFPREQSDRMAAGSVAGSAVGAGVGMVSTGLFVVGGCGVGGVIGGLAGAAIGGIPTGGVGAPIGAGIGASVGCLTGAMVGGFPGMFIGGALGALAGGVLGGLSGGTPQVAPPDPATVNAAAPIGGQPAVAPVSSVAAQEVAAPIINAVAPVAQAIAPGVDVAAPIAQAVEPVAAQIAPVVEQVSTAVDQFSQNVEQAVHDATQQVNSLGAALAQMPAMPALTPEDFLAAVQPAPPA